ncbi:diguanylate phosphodiesterase [Klebsiella variicola]|uniref:diguanylate phosphodiesterase n=1 Tax=Klebsiella variicola TaxID=244366 RepID=UPI0006BC782C|nr:diguanylate phosphodiesterase [Klebsiella variicola]BAS35552.1 BLUF domain/cyclic diguanylatephosphodiesterase [Klebsiella pneumoniae]
MLTTLIYRSQVDPAWPLIDLDALIHRASGKNMPLGITGILLFNGQQFFQVLEGNEEILESLFSAIQCDPRHRDVVELMRDYSAFRRFRDVGMRMLDLRHYESDDAVEAILRFSTFGETEPINDRMFRLISAFIADGGRYCLPESLQPSRWTMTPAMGNASPRNLADQPCQFALQAIVEPAKRRVSSFEALIRSPTGGSPVEMFAAIAAEDRYRFDLESKAFAFSLAARLSLGKQQLAINLLPGSLYHHPDAVGWLMDNLLAAGLRPEQVLIEVTETEVISCFDQFRRVLKALRVAGMKLAIDDFGAGYSGLSLLTRFQPDKIKVDAELVRDIHISGTKQAIVASVVRCCEDLGITVVAEGVETIEEWCWLQSVGIRLFQGFLFSRPCLNGIGEICWPVARQATDL